MSEGDPQARRPAFDATITLRARPISVCYRNDVGRDSGFLVELGRADRMLQASARREAERMYRGLAVRAIEAWDLADADGRPVPIEEAVLEPLRIGALQRIVREAVGRSGG